MRIGTKSSQWDPNLVLHARMQEGPREIAFDYSGSSNHGKIIGAAWGSPGLVFDGVDDYVQIPASTSLDFTTDFSVEYWIKIQNNGVVVASSDGIGGWKYINRLSTDGGGSFDILTSDVWRHLTLPAGTTPGSNVWFHFVYSRAGSTGTVYINGVNKISVTQIGSMLIGRPIRLMMRDTNIEPVNGTIDEVRIYYRALSASEILTRYNSTKSKYGL